ncbi:16 kDa beta-galactoside-binding lectin [Chelonia mydas]|uniref:Galectin n=1 Tax=Chelonia mydas TaxID=8469 RepID=M7AXI7_CHEMY|nr:16 kDa beta-galactoside-binding lectin [Chelonia mydas]
MPGDMGEEQIRNQTCEKGQNTLNEAGSWGLVATHLNVQVGECIKVKGKILPEAKGFAVNVGKDRSNLVLHFNPRFDSHGDVNVIVCNSMEDGMWGTEERETDFPFQQGDKTEICISFDTAELMVKVAGDKEIVFPNRLGLQNIEYLSVEGDFAIKAIKFS